MRPPLRGVSVPIPNPGPILEAEDQEAMITAQMDKLAAIRREIRANKAEKKAGEQGLPQRQPRKAVPRIIGNVQIVPPKGASTEAPPGLSGTEWPSVEESARVKDQWNKVQSKKARARARKREQSRSGTRGPPVPQQSSSQMTGSKKNGTSNNSRQRKPPKTAAVAIRGVTEGFSYAHAIRQMRQKIDLPKLGIEGTKIRHTVNGSVLIEIPGPKGNQQADILQEKLIDALGPRVKVSRPMIRGDIRIIGLDDSITSSEIEEIIVKQGNCKASDIKVGQIRPMNNGLFMVWAQCPLASAIQVSASGKIRIGWTVARKELLKARPTQCFRCWEQGHLKRSALPLWIGRTCATDAVEKDTWPDGVRRHSIAPFAPPKAETHFTEWALGYVKLSQDRELSALMLHRHGGTKTWK